MTIDGKPVSVFSIFARLLTIAFLAVLAMSLFAGVGIAVVWAWSSL